jgi:hypothetical protein
VASGADFFPLACFISQLGKNFVIVGYTALVDLPIVFTARSGTLVRRNLKMNSFTQSIFNMG